MKANITVLPGDGIGPEIMSAALQVMRQVGEKFGLSFDVNEQLMGGCSYDAYGTPLTDETLQACYEADAVLLGAVGGYKWEKLEHHLKPEAALLKLRKSLGLYANIRPAKVYNSVLDDSSLKKEVLSGTDFVVLRELTGGIYFGQPRGHDREKGWNTMVYARSEIERIARKAFEIARLRKKRVTSVDKANVLEVSQFWRDVVAEVHGDYPDIELTNLYVDNTAMQIVREPRQFDLILTSNLFGDILSDIAGMITGSLGMLPSASVGEKYALYEPVHGSAPDIAGQNIANPIAAIRSVAMMFSLSFGLSKADDLIEKAVERTLAQGRRTADIFSKGLTLVNTQQMTESILENVETIFQSEYAEKLTL